MTTVVLRRRSVVHLGDMSFLPLPGGAIAVRSRTSRSSILELSLRSYQYPWSSH